MGAPLMRALCTFVVAAFITFSTSGCATIIKGYEDSVRLNNGSDSVRVFDSVGREIPVTKIVKNKAAVIYTTREIKLRSNQEHTLTIQHQGTEKKVTVYPRIGLGWLALDLVCGGLPSLYDAYTGNWNNFAPIDVSPNR